MKIPGLTRAGEGGGFDELKGIVPRTRDGIDCDTSILSTAFALKSLITSGVPRRHPSRRCC